MHARLPVLLLLLLGLCVVPALGERAAPIKDTALSVAELKLSTDLLQLAEPSHLPPGQSRQALAQTMQHENRYRSPGHSVRGTGAEAPAEVVYVYVLLAPGAPLSTVDPHAWQVRNSDEASGTVAAWVEVPRLLGLAAEPGVRQILPVLPPVTNSGSVTAESDRILLADQVRAQYGLTGAGVRIGVISDGVNSWESAVASGDLPATVHVLRDDVGGDEGTAMLEIVHDIAPGAELYFHDMGENSLDFNGAIDALAGAGCTVIVDDISWIGQPFFEDGSVATHIQDLTSTRNLLYLSSAGNAGGRHYQGMYRDGGTGWHDFSNGTNLTHQSLYLDVAPQGSVRIVLEWDDPWMGSANDYDLYLYDRLGGDEIVNSSYSQDGGDAPIEFISYENTGTSTVKAELDIWNYSAESDRTLEVFIYNGGGLTTYSNNMVAADSVFGHQAAANVVAVGAIAASDDGADTIEFYSSRGPSTIRYPATVQRMKPDVTGIDGVAVTGAGGFGSPFYGTSASAPGVAAVAALVWSGAPAKTAPEVRSALLSSATDLGPAGADTTFGRGRVNAVAFAQSLGLVPAPAVGSITPNNGTRGTAVAISGLAGSGFAPGATVALNRTGSAEIVATNVTVASPTTITCQFTVPSTAALGAWNVVVTNPGNRKGTLPGGFTITAGVPPVVAVPTGLGLPTDTDGDGLYDDVNGNGRADFADVVLFFKQMDWVGANEPLAAFDYNGNGRIDFADIVWLFNHL